MPNPPIDPLNPAATPMGGAVAELKSRVISLLQAGEAETALGLLTPATKRHRGDADLLCLTADALLRLQRVDEAVFQLRRAHTARPGHLGTLQSLAHAHRRLGQTKLAGVAVDKLLAIDPSHAKGLALKATILNESARRDDAERLLSEHAAGGAGDPEVVRVYAEILGDSGRLGEAIDLVRAVVDRPEVERGQRLDALYVLGKLLDRDGSYDEAFAALSRANNMLPEQQAGDARQVIDAWPGERLASIEPQHASRELPVFVVGVPRSGTTLTEQILASHPGVATVGESPVLPRLAAAQGDRPIDAAEARGIGSAYLESLDRVRRPKLRRVVDKLPGNAVHLGLISRAMSGASMIACERDPRDACLSCFFQNFGHAHGYTRRLETCADYMLVHHEIMRHWFDVLDRPPLRWGYEALLADPDRRVRELTAHVGLPFDPACLKFYESKRVVHTASSEQVRRPIYTSSRARWRNYEKHIGPMLERLGPILPADDGVAS